MKMRKLAALLLAGCLIMGNAGVVAATEAEDVEASDKASKNSIAVQAEKEVETQAAEANTLGVVYVSAAGNDESGAGTQESPVATLAKAVDVAKDGATVYVMSDLTMTKSARYYGKNLTVTSGEGGPFTLTRGENFAQQQDAARSTYNPAMIEVDSTAGPGTASLTLTNIVLDDGGIHEGEYFVQADSEGDGHTTVGKNEVPNTNIVQDGMIATYNGVGTITLGEGAVLKNYGGMCAVRLSSGELIMQSGSQIIDDSVADRDKGATGSFGPAGAVWLQGGTITMEQGSIIGGLSADSPMVGRAIYADSGYAAIGGAIQNIKGDTDSWEGQNGVAVHLRGGASAALSGSINGVTGENAGNNSAIWTQFCNFTAESGSRISNVNGFKLLYFDDLGQDYSHKVLFDGTISNCTSSPACLLYSWYGTIELGENGVIENCTSNNAGGLLYSSNGTKYIIRGTIQNNTASSGMIYMVNQGGGRPECTIEPTAKIIDNTGLGIRVNNGSLVTMNGGEIARNSGAGVQVSGKTSWRGVEFIMNGGSITDNGSYGISYTVAGESLVEINGGTISGNNSTQISASGGYAVAEQNGGAGCEYVHVGAGTLGEQRRVRVSAGTVELPEGYADVNLGRATPDAVNALKAGVAGQHSDWKAVGSTGLWIQPDASEYSFSFDPLSTPGKTGLFVAYMPVDVSGAPLDGASVTVSEVENDTWVPISLEGLTPGQPYVVMLFNNAEYTLSADDTAIYIGGGQGDETYDDGGFPAITMYSSVDEIETMTVNGEPVVEDEANGVTYESTLINLLEVTYLDEWGNPVESDARPGEYTVSLDWKDEPAPEVRINGNDVNPEFEEGTLIVRYIENVDETQRGETTYELLTEEPAEAVGHAVAIAKENSISPTIWPTKFYTNDETVREVGAEGIRLLDDDLLTNLGDGRQELMEQKAVDFLGAPGEGQAYRYDFHYLDLVDAYNGNAWVSASYGATVYLPYPEGVTKDTAEQLGVKVIHYKDLHREYGISGQAEVEEAIVACELETMEAEFTDAGIKFDTERAGFSPFAVVWQTTAYTITASAGNGGTITPSGSVIVGEGADKSFVIIPNDGCSIAEIQVDGQAVELAGIVDENGIGKYTFENVTSDHTIEVTFKDDSTIPDGGHGSGGTGTDGTDSGQDDAAGEDNVAGKDNAGQDQAVKTGDMTNVMLYFIMAGAALCVAAGTLAFRKIRK